MHNQEQKNEIGMELQNAIGKHNGKHKQNGKNTTKMKTKL